MTLKAGPKPNLVMTPACNDRPERNRDEANEIIKAEGRIEQVLAHQVTKQGLESGSVAMSPLHHKLLD